MDICKETRWESYKEIKPKTESRKQDILEALADNEMTATEIAETLYNNGLIAFVERNFSAPRLTELKIEGKVVTVGKKYCEKTGRKVAIWAKVK